jgi:hypothetical protein
MRKEEERKKKKNRKMLTMFLGPIVAKTISFASRHVLSKRALLFIERDDKGGKHGYKYRLVYHSLFGFHDPIDVVIYSMNVPRGIDVDEPCF